MNDSTVPLSAKSLRTLSAFLLAGSVVLIILRAWAVPTFYHDGIYIDFAVFPALVAMAIGMGLRIWLGNDRRNLYVAVASVLGGTVVLVLGEYLVAHGLLNRMLEEQGEPGMPLLGPANTMLVVLLQQYQRAPIALVSGFIGLCAAGYVNLAKTIRRPGLQG